MAKKALYKTGDIIKLPLKNGVYGFGRILLMRSPAMFVGFYDVVSKDEIDIEKLMNKKYILKIQCGDVGIKKGEWKVIGNIPILEEISLPFFWDKNGLTGELYLRKYQATKENPLAIGADFVDTPATEKEIKEKEAQPDGAFGWKAAEAVLGHYLEKAGILK